MIEPLIDPVAYQETLNGLRLEAVFLDSLHSFCDQEAWGKDVVTISLEANTFARQTPAKYHAYIRYVLTGEQSASTVLKLDATYRVSFHTDRAVPDGFFDIFREINLKMTTMPYFRELVASVTGRMGLPTVTLPYNTPVTDEEDHDDLQIETAGAGQLTTEAIGSLNAATLEALTVPTDIAAAFQTMSHGLQNVGQHYERFIGWPGGGDTFRIYWHQDVQLWSLAEAFGGHHPGYWFGFGILDPTNRSQMSPDVQLGMPGSGSNRRYAGAFARDEEGRVYATHSGRFQVGYQRTDPQDFLAMNPQQNVAVVRWPDGFERVHLLVSLVDDSQITSAVSTFVHSVEAYKENLRGN